MGFWYPVSFLEDGFACSFNTCTKAESRSCNVSSVCWCVSYYLIHSWHLDRAESRHFAIFGGWDGSREGDQEVGAENDIWILQYDLSKHAFKCTHSAEEDVYVWRELDSENEILGRDACSITYIGDKRPLKSIHDALESDAECTSNSFIILLLFGGCDPDFNYLNDIFFFNLGTRQLIKNDRL